MPSSSQKQHNFMEAIAHSAKFAKQAGVPVSVGQDFAAADKKSKKFAGGGPVQGPLTQSRNLLTQTVVQPSDVDKSDLRTSLPRVYGALAGLAGTPPDQLEGSVLEPGYDARQQGAAMTFPVGTALQMLPGLKGLATAMAAEKLVPSGSLAAQRGVIIGPSSALWSKDKAFQADRLLKSGADADNVWSDLGVFRGPDGNLRQEISDRGLGYLNPDALANKSAELTQRNQDIKGLIRDSKTEPDFFPKELRTAQSGLRDEAKNNTSLINNYYGYGTNPSSGNFAEIAAPHPTMYDAYPELKDYVLRQNIDLGGARGEHRPNQISLSPIGMTGDTKGTLAHEFQHAIQDIEGWSGGTNMEYEGNSLIRNAYAKLTGSGMSNNDAVKAIKSIGLKGHAFDAYSSYPGEQEARAVAIRQGMSDEQRTARSPIHDYSPSMGDIMPQSPTFDEHLNAVIGRSVSDPTFREAYPELKDSDLSQSYADGGSVQDPIAARLRHIVFNKPLDQIDEHDHAFINSLIQKGRK